MDIEVSVHYTSNIINAASRRFFVRFIGLRGGVGFALLWACVAVLYLFGVRSWYVTSFGTIAVLATVTLPVFYFLYKKRSVDNFKHFSSNEVVFRFRDEEIEIRSSIGQSHIKWQMIQKLWCFPEVWLLFLSKQQYLILPFDALKEELQDFILKKFRRTKQKSANKLLFEAK